MTDINLNNNESPLRAFFVPQEGNLKNTLNVTNNKARYYAELAEKHKNDAKAFRDDAKYYAEQNSDVTKAYVDAIDARLTRVINTKQDSGDYALHSELAVKVSDLQNDSNFVTETAMQTAINTAVPECSASGKVLYSSANGNVWDNLPNSADRDLQNLSTAGEGRLHALKSYEDKGELLTDAEGLADVKSYAHSTFDSSKFTLVGSATITDGICQTASSGSYATAPAINLGSYDSWKIKYKFTTANDVSPSAGILAITKDGNFFGGAFFQQYQGLCYAQCGSTASQASDVCQLYFSITANTTYNVIFEFTGTQYKLSYSTDNGANWTDLTPVSSTTKVSQSINTTRIGNLGSTLPFYGTIDLRYFTVEGDGAIVFSGNKTGTDTYTIGGSTVTIPYTLSKTGSKIVDSAYRTQVTSVYNTFGYAPYYTLSDTNFTLPQGELYGMMSKQSVESYVSGQSWYRVYSDGWCRQGGFVDMTSSSATIVLLKEYKDTNYSVLLTTKYYNSNAYAPAVNTLSTDQFTAYTNNANCDLYWVTEGYIS